MLVVVGKNLPSVMMVMVLTVVLVLLLLVYRKQNYPKRVHRRPAAVVLATHSL